MKWPFSKKESNATDRKEQSGGSNPAEEALLDTINTKRAEDPLIGAKIGAKEIVSKLINGMKDDKGVHIESFISVLGSLAGYSCQASLRRELIDGKGMAENQVFTIVEDKNGGRYFYGDLINKPLAENQLSVWSIAAGALQRLGLGVENIVDINEIFGYVANTIGSDSFGIPRIDDSHKPGDSPVNYVRALWPALLPTAEKYCGAPSEWPVMFGLAVQEAITMGKDALDPVLALSIAMECAIPMAKADIVFA